MCTLAIYFRVFDEYPLVIAANRDEYLNRPALPPVILQDEPRIVGGKDLKAGGTWLGINQQGMVAALLNRRSGAANDPTLRSRGLLCLEALERRTAREASEYAAHQRPLDYNPFNLLMASKDEAFVAYNFGNSIEIVALTPGMHLLTNLDLNDFECPRISRSWELFNCLSRESRKLDAATIRSRLARLLSDHSTQLDPRLGGPNSICMHLESYGTRSSSIIMFSSKPGHIEHYFAEGPPCTTPHQPALIP